MFSWILSILLASLLVIFMMIVICITIDIVPVWKTWYGRIHIGRYEDPAAWAQAISAKTRQWLKKTPTVPLTDQSRWTVIERFNGQYSRKTIQHWQEAVLLLGVNEMLAVQDDVQARAEVSRIVRGHLEQGNWRQAPEHVDEAMLAYALLKTDSHFQYRKAYEATWAMIQSHIGADGTVCYRKSAPDVRYVDTIGFICPFLVAYGVLTGNETCIALAMKQIEAYEQHGLHEQHGIPFHAYSVSDQIPLGLYGWGRGAGWYAIGLVDAWRELPDHHQYKPVLQVLVHKYAVACMDVQQADGSWRWTITREVCRADTSTAAAIGWLLVNAASIEDIAARCLDSVKKTIDHLMHTTRRDGAIDFSQGDTRDIGVYSMRFNILPFTQGLAMRLMHSYQNQRYSQ